MHKRVIIPVLMLAASVLGVLPASRAYAGTGAALPITSFYQIVADTAHGHLFISQGSSSANDILVTDLAGNKVATITGQDGVTGIALSPDGSTLYAALAAAHAVSAIDTATLQQTASYPLGSGNTPMDVAVQSGKVWVSYNTATPAQAAIGDIDLSAATPAFQTQQNMGGWYAAPELAADPQDTGVLVAAEPGSSPTSIASYDTSVEPATVRAQSSPYQVFNCDTEDDLAVVPGGSGVILACGSPYTHNLYSTADLTLQGSYPSTNYPDAVAIAANGDVAAGTEYSAPSPDLYLYQQGGSTALDTFNLASSGGDPAPRGLAWSSDSSELFAVLKSSGAYSLRVIYDPGLTQSTLSLTGPSSAYIGQSVTLAGTLTLATGAPPSGTDITITRSAAGGGSQTFTTTTGTNGGFTFTDTPPAVGQYSYTASYGGTATIARAVSALAVDYTLVPSTLTLNGPSTAFITKSVTLTGSLALATGAPPSGTDITITRSAAGGGSQTFTATTAANGSFTFTDTPPALGQYTYAASYGGTATTEGATASLAVNVTLIPSILVLNPPLNAYIGKSLTLTGSLMLADGAPVAGADISVVRSAAGGTGTKTFAVTTAVDGSYTLNDTPPALGQYTYTATYGGDTTTTPATASQTLTVTRAPGPLTVSTGPTTFTYEPTIHVTAHLGATYTNRKVSIYAQRFGSKIRKLLKAGKVNSHGNLTVSYTAPHNTTFTAVFSGDAQYARAKVVHPVYIRAKVSESLSGHYSSRRVKGVTYWLYHRNAVLKAAAAVAPDKAHQCVEFEAQEYYQGAWHANVTTGCRKLSSSSKASVKLGLTHADLGYHYRIRADYLSNDSTNVSNDSPWRYLIVTS